jgi:hypothetical protein
VKPKTLPPSVSRLRNAVFWYMSLTVLQLLVTANVVPSSLILLALIMEVIPFSETSVLTRATRATYQETTFLIVTAIKTSNLTYN